MFRFTYFSVNMSLAINDNYCREVNPRYEITPPPQPDRTGPHYVTANVKFPIGTGKGKRMSWSRQRRL